jgi:hypothetical protein
VMMVQRARAVSGRHFNGHGRSEAAVSCPQRVWFLCVPLRDRRDQFDLPYEGPGRCMFKIFYPQAMLRRPIEHVPLFCYVCQPQIQNVEFLESWFESSDSHYLCLMCCTCPKHPWRRCPPYFIIHVPCICMQLCMYVCLYVCTHTRME